jgi:hypothetical protein
MAHGSTVKIVAFVMLSIISAARSPRRTRIASEKVTFSMSVAVSTKSLVIRMVAP